MDIPELLLGGGAQYGLAIAFLAAAAIVVVVGSRLSVYGDALSERTGLGAGLVGLLFLAAITSLPELVVSITSVFAASIKAADLPRFSSAYNELMRGGADLAIGNMIGSNVFNLALFVVMDLVQGKGALIFRLSRNHIMSAASGLGLFGIVVLGVAFDSQALGGAGWIIPHLETGLITPLLLVGYIVVMVLQSRLEKRETDAADVPVSSEVREEDPSLVNMSAPKFYGILLFMALMIVIGGMWLSFLGDRIALPAENGGFGLGQSLVGTIFLALSTSLPELVVCVAAVRMGSYDMAAGNVLGSNIFNLVIIFFADIGLRGGSILFYASPAHLVTMAMVMMITCTVIVGLMYRTKLSFLKIGLDAWIIILIYIFGNVVLFIKAKPEKLDSSVRMEETKP